MTSQYRIYTPSIRAKIAGAETYEAAIALAQWAVGRWGPHGTEPGRASRDTLHKWAKALTRRKLRGRIE